ncbi:MAG: hypothetical protein M1827_001974 [Pycnora praestabilis]|nr:MAG: hypothetical protein M1827_001974 [Pycnora praestabilis]
MDGRGAQSSFFGHSPLSQERLLPQSEHELPLLDSTKDISASTNSLSVMSSSRHRPRPSSSTYSAEQTMSALQRKERQLQQDLQELLDVQSEGLIAGVEGRGLSEDGSSNGSSTPKTSVASVRAKQPIPIRQPKPKKVGLRGARRGILNAMQELAAVKVDEDEVLETEAHKRDEVLRQVKTWEEKREGLEGEIDGITSGEEGTAVQNLSKEANSIRTEITELESRLFEMQAKHRALTIEISEIESSVQSKLSSYKASLSLLESQVRRFLAKPPLTASWSTSEPSPFFTLPAKRRTLDMASEHWEAERSALQKRRTDFGVERTALEHGTSIWAEVITEVTAFEKRLRQEMQQIGTIQTDAADAFRKGETAESGMQEILALMDKTIGSLDNKLKLVEARDWKLLVCCIGAELEAFKEGKEVLQDVLNLTSEPTNREPVEGSEAGETSFNTAPLDSDMPPDHGLRELQDQPDESKGIWERSEDEDDEPDPELLISHQDTD